MSFSIRLTAEEKALKAFKRALFERVEDEYDIAVADEAYREYVDGGRKSRPISKLWGDLEL